jgi:hypothetical protein
MRVVERVPKLGPVDARLVLSDIYDMEFGIFPHLAAGNSRPLASDESHPAEITDDGLLEAKFLEYHQNNIGGYLKMTFQEYLDLDFPTGKRILAMCKLQNQEDLRTKKTIVDNAEAALNDAAKQ